MSRLTLRLPNSLHEQLKEAAKREGVSLNQYVVYTLAQNAPGSERPGETAKAQAAAFHSYLERTPKASEAELRAFLEARLAEPGQEPDLDAETVARLQERLRTAG